MNKLLLTSPNWRVDTTGTLHTWQSMSQRKACEATVQPGFDTNDLVAMRGNWTILDERKNEIVIATDPTRSHSLVYAFSDGSWVISDDIEKLRDFLPFRANQEQFAVFEHMAFTLGNETLVANVFSTPAATVTRLYSDGSTKSECLTEYKFNPAQITDPGEFSAEFSAALDAAFNRLISDSGDRQLVVPLSGGLDSRLIAIWLRKFDAPNVTCFTYGKTGSPESGISKQVADDLGLPWLYVPMDTNEVRRAWHEPSTDSFLRATWKGTSLPHVQDWYALHEMKAKRLVAEDAIFLPGHTIVGNMHDEELAQRAASNKEIIDALLKHHANTQGKWRTASKLPTILNAIAEVMAQYKDAGSRRVQEVIEWFNLSQRQAKYINNSMASYEHFGYSWALPMLETELWDVWLAGSPQLTLTRDWYADFVNKEFANQTGKQIELFEPPSTRMPGFVKHLLLAGMRATKADILLERHRSAQTVLHHPMSFEALTDVPPLEQRIKIMRGANQLSFWVTAFLNNSWGGQGDIVPAHS